MSKLTHIFMACIVAYFNVSAAAQALPSPGAAGGEPVAGAGPKHTLMLSPYTYHFNPKPTHRPVVMLGLEREHANAKLDGLVLFTNSFGQPSVYLYPWGGVYPSLLGIERLSFKWTGGVIYGYTGEFKDEVANVRGIAPVLIFGLTYQVRPGWSVQINSLGKAAAQLQVNLAL